jgi:DNA-binding FadR family transcriptional regulator
MVRQKASTARPSAHARVARALGLAIVSGEFPVGSFLPGKEVLMQRFGVSNTVLREAMQALSAKGLVAARTKIGTWVADQSQWNMFDADILSWQLEAGVDKAFLARLFEMRQTLEPMAAAAAALQRTPAQAERLVDLAAAMSDPSHDRASFTAIDVAFHLCLLEASGNPFMRSIGAAIATALAASFEVSAPPDDPVLAGIAHRQHAAIAEAVSRQDSQAAADAMVAAIRQGWTFSGSPGRLIATLDVQDFPLGRRGD